jgi:hypothetical protein
MTRRALAISALPLAWVLWMRTAPSGSSGDETKVTWERIEAMSDEARCKMFALERGREVQNILGNHTFQCLPDTVDPRTKR